MLNIKNIFVFIWECLADCVLLKSILKSSINKYGYTVRTYRYYISRL